MAYNYDPNARYAKTHDWVRIEDGLAVCGISDYAQHALSDVVYVDLPEAGTAVSQGEVYTTVESVKAAEEVFAPISGEIVAVNEALGGYPRSAEQRALRGLDHQGPTERRGRAGRAAGRRGLRRLRGGRGGRRSLMPFIANTDADRAAMLAAVGVARVEDLFHDVPEAFRYPTLDLPEALSELEAVRELTGMAAENENLDELTSFLGAGAYRHFIPSVVDFLAGRSEFYTAYTPYQPEVSQGTLQAIFEYQSMVAALTGMDAANASHYDGATATAEAVIMALNTVKGKRQRVILSSTLNPQYREVVRTYTQGMGLEIVEADWRALPQMCDKRTICVVVQNPDFLGNVRSPQEAQTLADAVHACGALLAVAVDPISLGLFTPARPVRRGYRHGAKGSRWAFRWASAGRIWAFSPCGKRMCASRPAASPVRRWTWTTGAAMC
jgi:glycine cleavage system H lipoate-binding protein